MQSLHDLTVGNDWVSAIDFWRMTPGQVWWLIAAKMPDDSSESSEEFDAMVEWYREEAAKDHAA